MSQYPSSSDTLYSRTDPFVRLAAIYPGQQSVCATILDPFHHFRVSIQHDRAKVTDIQSETLRVPFDLCPSASHRLRLLVGTPLTTNVFEILGNIDSREQCTHQFDLASQSIVAAAMGAAPAFYRMTILPIGKARQHTSVTLWGKPAIEWTISSGKIEHLDVDMVKGFSNWASQSLASPTLEQALMLRRAWFIFHQIERTEHPSSHAPATGGCWVQHPGRAERATRTHTNVQHPSIGSFLDDKETDWLSGS